MIDLNKVCDGIAIGIARRKWWIRFLLGTSLASVIWLVSGYVMFYTMPTTNSFVSTTLFSLFGILVSYRLTDTIAVLEVRKKEIEDRLNAV